MQNRRLGLIDTSALVVGTIIGTGVFLKAGIMANTVGSPLLVLLAWVVAGILSLAGALAYAELGILFPKAGGEYVYIREAYGDLPAFLYGWQRFWAANPGTIAAYAVGAATFAAPIMSFDWIGGPKGFAILLIAIFTFINCMTITLGGRVQSFMTALKLFLIFFLIFGIFAFSKTGSISNISSVETGWTGFSSFGAAMLAALWAYDGWNNMPMVAGEVKNPSRNIPMALGLGMLLILVTYVAIHAAYFYALPFGEVLTSNSKFHPDALPVATKAAETFLGEAGYWILAVGFLFSAVGAMNGSILTNARVPYALAVDGLFLKPFAALHPKTQSPVFSLIVQGFLSAALALSGTFDQLTDYVVFASWIFYALSTSSIFVFRRKYPEAERTYKAFGYPWLPFVFVVLAIALLINTLITAPRESLAGLILISLGIPVYLLIRRRSKNGPAS